MRSATSLVTRALVTRAVASVLVLGTLVLGGAGCATSTPVAHGATSRFSTETAAVPIAWQTFGPEAFETARREGKLVMIDAGIEGCTACRWMHEGPYRNAAVVDRVRASFVPISVDADQEPDLGARYEPWGWPATIFLTPDGQQVYALQGSESAQDFAALLDDLVAKRKAGTLRPSAATAHAPADANLTASCIDANHRLEASADATGWGGEERVPLSAPFEHALVHARSRGDTKLAARAAKVADGEAKILDPVWGGVFVAAFSKTWDAPIPEKRTAEEAAALDNFALAYHRTGDAAWLARAGLVRRYLEGWMLAPDGTFYSTQRDEAPNLARGMDASDYYKLGDADRRKYGIPRIDHGVYTDQNAATIEAYVRLFEATGDAAVLAIATRATDALLARRVRPDGGMRQVDATKELKGDARLRPNAIDDRLYLKPQGEMGLALLRVHEATGDARYLDAARGIAKALTALEDPAGGFYSATARGTDALVGREKPALENATAARFLARLGALTRDDATTKRAERTLSGAVSTNVLRSEGPWTTSIAALAYEEVLVGPVEITVVRGGDDAAARALRDAALRVYEPRKIVRVEDPGHYPKPQVGAAAYVCTKSACSSPVHEVEALRATVDRMTRLGADAPCSP